MAAGNQHLKFTAEIWTDRTNSPTPEKEDQVQIVTKDEFFHHLWQQQPFAELLQETWLTVDETLESEGYTLICSGLPSEKQSLRGSHGVAIALSSQAMTV